jgi:hypothetical protein
VCSVSLLSSSSYLPSLYSSKPQHFWLVHASATDSGEKHYNNRVVKWLVSQSVCQSVNSSVCVNNLLRNWLFLVANDLVFIVLWQSCLLHKLNFHQNLPSCSRALWRIKFIIDVHGMKSQYLSCSPCVYFLIR